MQTFCGFRDFHHSHVVLTYYMIHGDGVCVGGGRSSADVNMAPSWQLWYLADISKAGEWWSQD